MNERLTRRVVTGHAADGRSVVLSDGVVPNLRHLPNARFDEIWATGAAPETLSCELDGEPTSDAAAIGPAAGGSVLRITEFAPGGGPSPMHRTRTIDYGIVLEGEMVLILSDSEVVLATGDVAVQRGTDHAWHNRSGQPAKMAFVLLDAVFDDRLAGMLSGEEIMP